MRIKPHQTTTIPWEFCREVLLVDLSERSVSPGELPYYTPAARIVQAVTASDVVVDPPVVTIRVSVFKNELAGRPGAWLGPPPTPVM